MNALREPKHAGETPVLPGLLKPGAVIGILGGGQLARMLVLAGHRLGFEFMVLDPAPDCPAALVGAKQITAGYADASALEELAETCNLVTYEFENVDADAVALLETLVDVPQGSELLKISQNRLHEKNALEQLGIPVTPFKTIRELNDLRQALREHGEVMLKTASGGYDGKGQQVVRQLANCEQAFHALIRPDVVLIAERLQNFTRELSVVVTRNRSGEIRCFPVAENLHTQNVLTISRIPARISQYVEEKVNRIARQIAAGFKLSGVLGVELFLLDGEELLVNEIAPRPHNSGHFTQNGCRTCQFEQHLRAVADWPLGPTDSFGPIVMFNLLGNQLELLKNRLRLLPPEAKLHLYGKHETRPGRKMGHLNIPADSLSNLRDPLSRLGIWEPELLELML